MIQQPTIISIKHFLLRLVRILKRNFIISLFLQNNVHVAAWKKFSGFHPLWCGFILHLNQFLFPITASCTVLMGFGRGEGGCALPPLWVNWVPIKVGFNCYWRWLMTSAPSAPHLPVSLNLCSSESNNIIKAKPRSSQKPFKGLGWEIAGIET